MNIKEKYQICIYSMSMIRWCLKYIFIIISLCVAYFSAWRCGCTYCTSVHIRVCLFWQCNIAVVLCKVNIKEGNNPREIAFETTSIISQKTGLSSQSGRVQRQEKLPFLILCSICLPISQQTPPIKKKRKKKCENEPMMSQWYYDVVNVTK